jgi:hypothetical protein
MKWAPTGIAAYILVAAVLQVSFPRPKPAGWRPPRQKIDLRGEYGKMLDSIVENYNHRLDSFVQRHKTEFYE